MLCFLINNCSSVFTKTLAINPALNYHKNMKDNALHTNFYTVEEFSKELRIHPNTVYTAIQKGRINAFRVGAGEKSPYRIPATEINAMALKDMEKRMEGK